MQSLAEASGRIRQAAAAAKPGQVIYTTGRWKETELVEKRGPTREELDRLVPDRPVVVWQGRENAYWNTAALKAAGISRETKSVGGGPVRKDSRGEPTGVITGAFPILTVAARLIPIADIRELIRKVPQEQNALGLTSIREPMVPLEIMRLYWDLWREGKLTLRVSMGLDVDPGQADDLDEILGPLGVGPGFGDHWLHLDSIGEFSVDGNSARNSTPEMFRRGILKTNRYGWRAAPHITGHTAGDTALDVALDSYEAADREKSIRDRRWVVEHIPMVRTDQMDRLLRLGVVVSAQF